MVCLRKRPAPSQPRGLSSRASAEKRQSILAQLGDWRRDRSMGMLWTIEDVANTLRLEDRGFRKPFDQRLPNTLIGAHLDDLRRSHQFRGMRNSDRSAQYQKSIADGTTALCHGKYGASDGRIGRAPRYSSPRKLLFSARAI
jgi:hypothetical protein